MDIKVLRATEEWQRAGAYSVRIQAMNRAYHISLRDEFDEHDCDGTKFIVLLDDEYPVATCRFYEIDAETATIGRVVVMPEYRGQKLGATAVREAENGLQNAVTNRLSSTAAWKPQAFTKNLGTSIQATNRTAGESLTASV